MISVLQYLVFIRVGRRSPSLTTYEAGPIADPWTTLAKMSVKMMMMIMMKSENLVQWHWWLPAAAAALQ